MAQATPVQKRRGNIHPSVHLSTQKLLMREKFSVALHGTFLKLSDIAYVMPGTVVALMYVSL